LLKREEGEKLSRGGDHPLNISLPRGPPKPTAAIASLTKKNVGKKQKQGIGENWHQRSYDRFNDS
jgi:hypothetical protein